MKIVFIGSGLFAAPILEFLTKNFEVSLVVTRPDAAKSRGQKLSGSVIGNLCEKLSIGKLSPETINSEEAIQKIRQTGASLAVLASYSEILGPNILGSFRLGIVNVHPSLLPKYRGAEPIRWAIRKCESQTGVTLMMLSKGLDRGNILAQQTAPILDTDDYTTLSERLVGLSLAMLPQAITAVKNGQIGLPQNQRKTFYARRLRPDDERIRWDEEAAKVSCHVRSMSPYPGCYTVYQGKRVKLFVPRVVDTKVPSPGTIMEAKKRLVIACKNGALEFAYAQKEGGKKLSIVDFLASGWLKVGESLINY